MNPSVLDFCLNRVFGEIVFDVGILFADHIQMALKNDRRRLIMAGCCGFSDDDISSLVFFPVEAKTLGARNDIVAQGFFAARTVGNS